MSTNFNYTGRVDIDSSFADANITEANGAFKGQVEWDFTSFGFPTHAVLKFSFEGLYEKRSFTPSGAFVPKGQAEFDISDLRRPLDATLTVRITEPDSNGIPVLLGLLSGFQPKINGNNSAGKSLLETRSSSTLLVPWRLTFETGRPLLEISNKEDLYSSLTNSELFDALVVPDVLEKIFVWLVFGDDDAKNSEIAQKWAGVFIDLGVEPTYFDQFTDTKDFSLESLLEVQDRAKTIADTFASRHKVLEMAVKQFEGNQ